MVKLYQYYKDRFNLPTIIMIIAVILGFFHFFSYFFPFTDDAFVVANVQTVAADVSGYITDIYVKNGQYVKKNSPLFRVFSTPYHLMYKKAKANYEEALAALEVLKEETQKDKHRLLVAKAKLGKLNYEYDLKKNKTVTRAVSKLEVKRLAYDVDELTHEMMVIDSELAINGKQIVQQEKKIAALKAERDNAKVMLSLTLVRAGSNGMVDNLYLSVGTPVKTRQPLFSFINTDEWYIQANFNETDLRYVKPGDRAVIVLRMYYFQKIFHGVIVNNLWVANRQTTVPRNQQQEVSNHNEWLNLPQRFPLQIKILDPDPRYPLNPGASAYVYLRK